MLHLCNMQSNVTFLFNQLPSSFKIVWLSPMTSIKIIRRKNRFIYNQKELCRLQSPFKTAALSLSLSLPLPLPLSLSLSLMYRRPGALTAGFLITLVPDCWGSATCWPRNPLLLMLVDRVAVCGCVCVSVNACVCGCGVECISPAYQPYLLECAHSVCACAHNVNVLKRVCVCVCVCVWLCEL